VIWPWLLTHTLFCILINNDNTYSAALALESVAEPWTTKYRRIGYVAISSNVESRTEFTKVLPRVIEII